MFWILTIVVVSLLFYYLFIKPQQYWRSKNVKQGWPIPLFGDNFYNFIRKESVTEMVTRIYNQFKNERYVGMYQASLPTLMIVDPGLIKQITVKDFDHFTDHKEVVPEGLDPIWTNNLFSLKGDQWRDMRATLSPTFTASKMRSMFSLMEKTGQQFIDFYLNQNKIVIELELKDSFSRFANDVIATCVFGVEVDSLKEPKNQFYLNGCELTDANGIWKNIKNMLHLSLPSVAKFFQLSVFSTKVTWFFRKIIQDTIAHREQNKVIRPDMIHLLMEARKERMEMNDEQKLDGVATTEKSEFGRKKHGKPNDMTEDDMAGQVMIFFFAGFDTISTMMSFTCYELATNPDIQEKLRNEVDEVHQENSGKLSYDIFNKMNYMDMVMSESMRKHSPLAALDRVCTKAYTIQPERKHETPLHLAPGDTIMLPAAGLHRDEELYPNPDKFDPERFSDENKGNINPYAYLPFGTGPRACIGTRFALMECKTLIFHILRNFEVIVIDKTPIPMKYSKDDLNPSIEGGFWVGFKRRNDTFKILS